MSAPSRSRREARERALELLYEARSKSQSAADVIKALPVAPDAYTVELATGVEKNRAELDMYIRQHVRGWAINRLPVIDRAILQMAIYEFQHRRDVPAAVVINEAVDLAKQYSTEESGRFVNGMLSALARFHRGSELAALGKDTAESSDPGDGGDSSDAGDTVEIDSEGEPAPGGDDSPDGDDAPAAPA